MLCNAVFWASELYFTHEFTNNIGRYMPKTHKIRPVKIPEWMDGFDGAPEVPSLTKELLITDSSWGNGNHFTLVLPLVGSHSPVESPHSSLHGQHQWT